MTPWLESDPVWGQIAACILFAREPCPKPSQGYNKSRRSSSTPRTVLMLAASPSMAHRSKQSSYVFTERISIKKKLLYLRGSACAAKDSFSSRPSRWTLR